MMTKEQNNKNSARFVLLSRSIAKIVCNELFFVGPFNTKYHFDNKKNWIKKPFISVISEVTEHTIHTKKEK